MKEKKLNSFLEIKHKFNRWRWKKLKSGYIFDRLIFKIGMLIIFFYLFFIAYSTDFDFSKKIYAHCPEDQIGGCSNDWAFNNTDSPIPYKYREHCVYKWCQDERLPAGFTFGKLPPKKLTFAPYISFAILILCFVFNHILHNKAKINWSELNK